MKSGFVSIVGRPNVGKSTLLNKLMNQKIAITSDKVGTTRNNIYGVYHEKDYQIIFVDTPGIQKERNKLGFLLNKKAYESFFNDLVLFIIDASTSFGPNDQKILDKLKKDEKEVILVLNKVDKLKKEQIIKEIEMVKDLYNFVAIVPISSLKGDNVKELLKVIKKNLKDEVKYFDDETITNVSERFMVSEIIREKILNKTYDEIPHSVTVMLEKLEFKKEVVVVNALIIIDKANIKKIIIGKNGSMLKAIGQAAREELELYFNKKVYLELFVKTIENWQDREKVLKELGLTELDE